MGALPGRANNPSTPKSFTSFALYLNQHINRQIYLLSKGRKEGVSEHANTGSGLGSAVLYFVLVVFVVVALFWAKSAKTTQKETRFLVATWAKKRKRNWNFTTRITLVNYLNSKGIKTASFSKEKLCKWRLEVDSFISIRATW